MTEESHDELKYDNDEITIADDRKLIDSLLSNMGIENVLDIENYKDYNIFVLAKESIGKKDLLKKLIGNELTERFSLIDYNYQFPIEGSLLRVNERTLVFRRNAYPLKEEIEEGNSLRKQFILLILPILGILFFDRIMQIISIFLDV